MAFPLPSEQIVAHIRSAFVAVHDNDISRRMIKSYTFGSEQMIPAQQAVVGSPLVNNPDTLAGSPPIAFDIARHLNKSYQRTEDATRKKTTAKHRRRKSRKFTDETDNLNPNADSDAFNEKESTALKNKHSTVSLAPIDVPVPLPVSANEGEETSNTAPDATAKENADKPTLNYSKTITGKKKTSSLTPSIVHFLRGGRSKAGDNLELIEEEKSTEKAGESVTDDDGSDDSDFDLPHESLRLRMGSNSVDDDDHLHDFPPRKDSLAAGSKNGAGAQDDVISIDSDFGVPVNAKGQVVRNIELDSPKREKIHRVDPDETIDTIERGHGDHELEYGEEDEEEDEYDVDDDDDDDEDYPSSTDSAFTDIEADSMLDDSSILLDSFNDHSYSFGNQNSNGIGFKSGSSKQKKKKGSDIGLSYRGKSPLPMLLLSSTTNSGINSTVTAATTLSSNTPPTSSTMEHNNQKKESMPLVKKAQHGQGGTLVFTKISVEKKPAETLQESNGSKMKKSNLSSMIQKRYRNTNHFPLSYFSFVNSETVENQNKFSIGWDLLDNKKIHLNVFLATDVQGKPTLSKMELNNNVTIFQCIGYILLQLHQKVSDFSEAHSSAKELNPNNWRIEMVDEDGETYGSFGVLDRTRLLSSYSGLTDLLLTRIINQEEISKNEKDSPLNLDLQLALKKQAEVDEVLEKRRSSASASLDDTALVEIKIITTIPSSNKAGNEIKISKLEITKDESVGHILREYCSKAGYDPNKYKFKEVKRYQSLLLDSKNSSAKYLKDTDPVNKLENNVLELVPFEKGLIGAGANGLADSYSITASTAGELNAGITPLEGTYKFDYIDADKKWETQSKAVNGDAQKVKSLVAKDKHNTKQQQAPKTTSKKSSITGGLLIQNRDFTSGSILDATSQFLLPTNINTIYFKWKIWRKKTTILQKIERFLIIDGDYIHLTPTDDVVFKKGGTGSPIVNQNTQTLNNEYNNHNNVNFDGAAATVHNNVQAINNNTVLHHHHFHNYNYSNYYNNLVMKTNSFHVTQIVKLKQYKGSKNPTHFKIVVTKVAENGKQPNKRYDLEAVSVSECDQIVQKIKWVQQVYKNNINFGG